MEHLAFILFEPQNDLNIGSVLRVAANFGIDDIRLVTDRDIDPDTIAVTATHSAHRLSNVSIYASLSEAVADCHHVFATSSRPRHANEQLLTPTVAAQKARDVGRSAERVAFLFGREDHGLPNDALDQATALVSIPTTPNYRSLNLAQAVLLIAWECFRLSLHRDLHDCPETQPNDDPRAERAQVERMIAKCKDVLDLVKFIKYGDGEYVMRAIRHTFARAELTKRELSIWFGIFSEIIYFVRKKESSGDAPP